MARTKRTTRSVGSAVLTILALFALVWFLTTARPMPASAQSGETTSVRLVSQAVNDVVYSPATGMLYASVPSSVGAGGNSIAVINPATGAVTASVFVGSEPTKLAISDDGKTIYVSLEGSATIRRFDVMTQTPGQQFSVGRDSFFGFYFVNDLAVAPGEPNVVAVARQFRGVSPPEAGVAVFDNGVQRTKTGPGHSDGSDFLAFSASASKLYGTGFNSGLKTYTVDATGVTVATSTTFGSGGRIKFDGTRVYAAGGQIINPDSGALLGTLGVGSSSNAHVPDAASGRAFYVSRESFFSGPLILKAFDVNTFVSVGSFTLTGVQGDPTTLVRWGANGLAFRNSFGQLFVIQTTLIPSAEPVPSPTPFVTPTPTPTPTPLTAFVRQVSLNTSDLVYNSADQSLYASVPSIAGAGGNSITKIDPAAGTVGAQVFIGSEPGKMALADDGRTLWVGLNGAGSVRRFDTQTQTAGTEFALGIDTFNGPRLPSALAVMPGSPNTVAVSSLTGFATNVTSLFDDGVRRSQGIDVSASSLTFGSASVLYAANGGGISKLPVTASGITVGSTFSTAKGNTNIQFNPSDGLIYTSGGEVIDPATGAIKGSFTGVSSDGSFALDPTNGRIYFLNTNFSSTATIRAFDINTFLPLGTVNVPGLSGFSGTTSLVRWGANGLAFRSGDGKVWLVQSSLVPSAETVPSPTPTPAATPTPTPTPFATFVRKVNLPANDLVYRQPTQTLYASVPSSAGASGNSITPINPQTGAVGAGVFVGSEPNRMALADDNTTLYVSLDGAAAIRRFDLQTQTPGLQFTPPTGFQRPQDMDVVPGSPQSIALSAGFNGVAVFDDGAQRGTSGKGDATWINRSEFASPTVLYGYTNESSGFDLVKLTVGPGGVSSSGTPAVRGLITGFSVDIKLVDGRLYSTAGRVVDPAASRLLGVYSTNDFSSGTGMAIDTALDRIFFVGNNGNGATIRAYRLSTFTPIGSITVPNVSGTPTSLWRWGTNGLAFRTSASSSFPAEASQVVLLQSTLVSSTGTVPSGVSLGASQFFATEGSSAAASFTVVRTGDLTGTTTINYATTTNGTATPVTDYTPVSGTLTFAPGESLKTVTVPLTNDNVFERRETIEVALSNPGGGELVTPTTAIINVDDFDSQPFVNTISDVRVNEGDSGTTEASFEVRLSNPSSEPATVNFTTTNGTATAGTDYVAASGTLNFPALATSAIIKVTINGDTTVEPDETFTVNLSGGTGLSFISDTQATGTIVNDDLPGTLSFSAAALSVSEDVGTATITVRRTNGIIGAVSVNYATSDLTAKAGQDYTATSGTLNFAAGETQKTFTVPVINDTFDEADETLSLALSSPTGGAVLGPPSTAVLTITNDDRATVRFSAASYSAAENEGKVVITVQRTGDTSQPAFVSYATSDGTASEKTDYNLTLGTLRFASNEAQKTFDVLLTNDALVEAPEGFFVTLSGAGGAQLGSPSTASVLIGSEDATPAATNPIDETQFFVRQHYIDFFNREPDAPGLAFWTGVIEECGADAQCREVHRINVSAAFFLSIEFKETGYLVYLLNQASFNTQERLRLRSFMADTQEIGRGVVVNTDGWQDKIEANKKAFIDDFVKRPEFVSAFLMMTNSQFVDALNQNTFDPLAASTGGALTQAERDQLVADLNAGTKTRAQVLRAVAENPEFQRRQLSKAFVLMQYFGYLRRNPNDAPEPNLDFAGYNFWLGNLNKFNGNFVQAELVKAFIASIEYRQRFGQ